MENAKLKVGDYFKATWGYDQTNVDFFQVVGVSGKSVRVREVQPEVISTEGEGGMSAYYTYALPQKILPPRPFSVFIKDQQKGDLKRVSEFEGCPEIKLRSYCHASLVQGDKCRAFVSWYA